jgi:hypothetical protein
MCEPLPGTREVYECGCCPGVPRFEEEVLEFRKRPIKKSQIDGTFDFFDCVIFLL